ncbi:MAG: hypothetical protein MJH11_15635 [Lentisphaeria bacterium]|nr:hypothetical protein [Lentisphaeria bacterium]
MENNFCVKRWLILAVIIYYREALIFLYHGKTEDAQLAVNFDQLWLDGIAILGMTFIFIFFSMMIKSYMISHKVNSQIKATNNQHMAIKKMRDKKRKN